MRINHNIAALNTYRQLNSANNGMNNSMEKLSSGLRINKAGDDAAGLSISEKMRSQVRGLEQASRNAQDGISMIQTAEGALNETHSILQRMRELSVQSSNDTNTQDDRDALQEEMNQLTSEITRIGNDTEFNTKKVLNGSLDANNSVQQQQDTLSDVDTLIGDGTSASFELTFGNTAITIQGDGGTVVPGSTPVVSSNTITVGTDGADATADDIIAGLQLYAAQNPDSEVAQFDFAKSSGTELTITAKASGEFAGADANNNTVRMTAGDSSKLTDSNAGADGGAAQIQIGANQDQQFSASFSDMRSLSLDISGTSSGGANAGGVTGAAFTTTQLTDASDTTGSTAEYALDITDADKATAAIKVLDNAIKDVSEERSKLGSYQNRLDHTINNLGTSAENLTAAESRIRDVDYALAA
ncbi:flagellin [Rossellomorea vietnamensis]|uniref:Flagellin n=1 Tax=Rossellomorea vietnamensis TaxID=218284 RepID=A0A5D4KFH3_9BACI|nr:flagellin [Rossellomorea vietnamensis]TYR76051.1 flagellin [Rossellomorea vietnamensis]